MRNMCIKKKCRCSEFRVRNRCKGEIDAGLFETTQALPRLNNLGVLTEKRSHYCCKIDALSTTLT